MLQVVVFKVGAQVGGSGSQRPRSVSLSHLFPPNKKLTLKKEICKEGGRRGYGREGGDTPGKDKTFQEAQHPRGIHTPLPSLPGLANTCSSSDVHLRCPSPVAHRPRVCSHLAPHHEPSPSILHVIGIQAMAET